MKVAVLEEVFQGDCGVSISEVSQKLVYITCSVAHAFKFFSLMQRNENF